MEKDKGSDLLYTQCIWSRLAHCFSFAKKHLIASQALQKSLTGINPNYCSSQRNVWLFQICFKGNLCAKTRVHFGKPERMQLR